MQFFNAVAKAFRKIGDAISGVPYEDRVKSYSLCGEEIKNFHPNFSDHYKLKSRTGYFVLVEASELNGAMTYVIEHVSSHVRLTVEKETFDFLFKVA